VNTLFRLAPAVALLTLGAAGRAAPEAEERKLACAVAYEQGQRLRNDGRLLAARAQLLLCSDDGCPAVLRGDCARWLTEVEITIPTVVLAARDAGGSELSDVRVELDGKLVSTQLDGRPLAVEPGQRDFRFVRASGEAIQQRVTIEAGEKERRIQASFGGGGASKPESGAIAAGVPAASWLLGGVGVASGIGFAYFALDGRSKKQELDRCSPACDPADVDAARRSFVIGDVLLAVSLSAFAGATLVYATRPDEPSGRPRIAPVVGWGAAGVSGQF
jgi:hypothetical protein